MSNSYQFLEIAKREADLADIVKYLEKPLGLLEELIKRCHKIANQQKINVDTMETYRQAQKLVNHYLPNLIQRYSEFSFKYRNTVKIKETTKDGKTTSYTAKELLLLDVARVIEQIELLENDFNESQKFEFLVNNRIMATLGQQPDISGELAETKVVLKNQFEYERFIPEQIFTKPDSTVTIHTNLLLEKESYKPIIKAKESSELSPKFKLRLTEFTIITIFMSMIIGGFGIPIYKKYQEEEYMNEVGSDIFRLTYSADWFYKNLEKKEVTSDTIKKFSTDFYQTNPKVKILIEPGKINKDNDSYTINIPDVAEKSCRNLVEYISPKVTVTKVNGIQVNSESVYDVLTACHKDKSTIQFTQKIDN